MNTKYRYILKKHNIENFVALEIKKNLGQKRIIYQVILRWANSLSSITELQIDVALELKHLTTPDKILWWWFDL